MRREVELFLKAYPSVEMIEALITDCNGVARGKWIPRGKIQSVLDDGLKLLLGLLLLDGAALSLGILLSDGNMVLDGNEL